MTLLTTDPQSQVVQQNSTNVNKSDKQAFIRTKEGCYKLQKSQYWGEYYTSIKDPKGVEAPKELEYLWLKENFNKLPYDLLQGIVTFFRSYMALHGTYYVQGSTEVQVCLLRGVTDPSLWKVVVPKQVVTAVTVDALTSNTCDLFTGEEYTVFPPEGFCHAGSIHSHAGMSSFWSGRDDKGELQVPGMHCTIGSITPKSFDICSSIVVNKKRYIFEPTQLINFSNHKTKNNGGKCKVLTVYDDTAAAISSTANEYVQRAPRVLPVTTHWNGAATTTLMPRDPVWTAADWDNWDEWGEFEDYNATWTVNKKRNKFRNYESDIKHELKHTLEYTDLSDRNGSAQILQNIDEVKDILNNLDIWADALLSQPNGKEVLAAMLAQKLDLNIHMPIAEDIINTCLY